MRCPGCGSEVLGGVGARCLRCGFAPSTVGVTPMEYVVHTTGTHRLENGRRGTPKAVAVLYGAGLLAWAMPFCLYFYYHANAMPGVSLGWRALGVVLAAMLAGLLHALLWAGAFFYGRLVTSDQIAEEAERGTGS
jgi:hypothetical protein